MDFKAYETSSSQQRIYIVSQLQQDRIHYNMPFARIVKGRLRPDLLETALEKLTRRHESLRTSFMVKDGKILQKVYERIEFKLELRKIPRAGIDELIRDFPQPFNLGDVPLWRAELVDLENGEYLFLFDIHHIAADGISMNIIFSEIADFYRGWEPEPLGYQYVDFTIWQNDIFNSGKIKPQEDYWLGVFKDEIPVLNLPTDFPRPLEPDIDGASVEFEAGKELTAKLKASASAHRTTTYVVLLAAYNILLSRYTGQGDIVVGTPTAGRPHAELEKIVGMFVNTLPMRNRPCPGKTVGDLLEEVSVNTAAAFENQDYPFEMLVEKLNVERRMNRNPLFDTMFVLLNFPRRSPESEKGPETSDGRLRFIPYPVQAKTAKFDLTLTAFEDGGNISFEIEYRTALFEDESIRRLGRHFINLLGAAAGDPGRRICEPDMLSHDEREYLLYTVNDTAAPFPEDKTLHGMFEDSALREGEAVALTAREAGGAVLTYRELNEKSGRLARVLLETGAGPGFIAGLMVEICPAMVIGMIAILKAGGAFLPVEPAFPGDRITFMLRDSNAAVVLTGGCAAGKVKVPEAVRVIDLDDPGLYDGECPGPGKTSHAGDPAYAIYTSGSTGDPKGVLIRHDNIVNQIYGLQKRFAFEPRFNHILLAPFTFDPSVQQVFLPLVSGGDLHLVSTAVKEDPGKLSDYIVNNGMDIVNTVPSLMDLLLERLKDHKSEGRETPHFKYIILAGELFSTELFEKIRDTVSVDTLINIYGPTEATINTTLYECKPEETVISIGKPLMNYKVAILDEYLNLLPPGVAGEICISGRGTAPGYLNRPDLTQEKFIPSPFFPGERMYLTGDLGMWLPDGNIRIAGRIDHQVKIRGSRVEMGEIENQLLKHHKIQKAVVVAGEYKKGGKDLCAYYVTGASPDSAAPGDDGVNVSELRQFLKTKLPDYMIPSYFMSLPDIPLSNNGKVDVKALPDIGKERMKLVTPYVAPSDEMETVIAGIWKDVLGLEKVGIYDNFFDLGGNSLDIVKVNDRLKTLSGGDVPLMSMFKYPTVSSLAEHLFPPAPGGGDGNGTSPVSDRTEVLKRGERDRNMRRQMRKKMRN